MIPERKQSLQSIPLLFVSAGLRFVKQFKSQDRRLKDSPTKWSLPRASLGSRVLPPPNSPPPVQPLASSEHNSISPLVIPILHPMPNLRSRSIKLPPKLPFKILHQMTSKLNMAYISGMPLRRDIVMLQYPRGIEVIHKWLARFI